MMLPSLPVIVGTGLTGCAISRSLSRAGIRHLLVGPRPLDEGARLGESLNLEGSLDIVDYFPEMKALYFAKTAVTSHIGDMEVRCDLNMQRGAASAAFYRALGYPSPPDAFLHIDRKGFDTAIFDAVVADPHCQHVDALVEAVDYDRASDRVRRLGLSGGREVAPISVFDATNHVRAVARHLGLELEILGVDQRSVYGHFEHEGPQSCEESLWHATHIVRLDPGRDGLDGLAWYIPLKGLASIGVGVDIDEARPDRELMELTYAAIERRGIVPPGRFRFPERVRSLPRYRHFLHNRAFGANWMLAGGTFCLMWFAASAGISSGFAAANVAPHFIREPARYGALYETLLKNLRSPHGVFEWIRRVDPGATSLSEIEKKADVLVEQSVLRLAMSVQLRPGVARNAVAGALARAIRGKLFDGSGICVRAGKPEDAIARVAALQGILEVFAGERPIDEIDAYLHEDVLVHIDRLRFRGRGGWKKWARHSRATWPFEQLRFEIVDHSYDPRSGRLEVGIAAVAGAGEGERRSAAERFVYRFEGDKVREIWTSRRNYTFLYGDRFATLPGFAAHVGRLMWWNLRRRGEVAERAS